MSVRIGLIGAGGISTAHVKAIEAIDDAAIVAVSDLESDRANTRAAEAKAGAVYTDFRKMLDEQKLDAVWVCTPPSVRAEPIEACIERKLPVFTEKPVGVSAAAAAELAATIERAGLPVMVGYVLRFMKVTDWLREHLAQDRVSLVCSTYCSPMTLNYAAKTPAPLWFYRKEISGGAIADQATHLFDLMRYLVGEVDTIYSLGSNCFQPKSAEYTVEDAYSVSFRFANGVLGVHGHTWCHASWRSGLTLYGAKGMYALNCMRGRAEVETPDGKTMSYQPDDAMFVNEDRFFIDMVRRGDFSKLHCSFADGARTLALTQKILDVLDSPTSATA